MSSVGPVQKLAAVLAAVPLAIPCWQSSAFGKDLRPPQAAVSKSRPAELKATDVLLLPGNVLAGGVHDSDGQPIADTEIVVSLGRQEIARGLTDELGEFVIEVPRGGTYLVVTGQTVVLVRAWTGTAAPPKCATRLHLTQSKITVRGQTPVGGGIDPLLGVLLIGGIAAAIAIPLAINANDDDNDNRPSASPP